MIHREARKEHKMEEQVEQFSDLIKNINSQNNAKKIENERLVKENKDMKSSLENAAQALGELIGENVTLKKTLEENNKSISKNKIENAKSLENKNKRITTLETSLAEKYATIEFIKKELEEKNEELTESCVLIKNHMEMLENTQKLLDTISKLEDKNQNLEEELIKKKERTQKLFEIIRKLEGKNQYLEETANKKNEELKSMTISTDSVDVKLKVKNNIINQTVRNENSTFPLSLQPSPEPFLLSHIQSPLLNRSLSRSINNMQDTPISILTSPKSRNRRNSSFGCQALKDSEGVGKKRGRPSNVDLVARKRDREEALARGEPDPELKRKKRKLYKLVDSTSSKEETRDEKRARKKEKKKLKTLLASSDGTDDYKPKKKGVTVDQLKAQEEVCPQLAESPQQTSNPSSSSTAKMHDSPTLLTTPTTENLRNFSFDDTDPGMSQQFSALLTTMRARVIVTPDQTENVTEEDLPEICRTSGVFGVPETIELPSGGPQNKNLTEEDLPEICRTPGIFGVPKTIELLSGGPENQFPRRKRGRPKKVQPCAKVAVAEVAVEEADVAEVAVEEAAVEEVAVEEAAVEEAAVEEATVAEATVAKSAVGLFVNPHRCNYCNFRTHKRSLLSRHWKCHREERSHKYSTKILGMKRSSQEGTRSCNFCNYTTFKRYLFSRHMRSHSEERPHKCSVCERGFKTVASLQNHMNAHMGIKPHRCKYCEATFTTSGELVRHRRRMHTHEKPHQCPDCDYASVELCKLKRHTRSHSGERPYPCPLCTYASADTFKLKRHLRKHTGEKPYECNVCPKRFSQQQSLKTHKLFHTGNQPVYQCELCPTTCGRKVDLRLHVQKLHTSGRPRHCKMCGKTFNDLYTVKVHKRTHNGEKCFKCDLCPYSSNSQHHLESHRLIHTGQKPFQCDQCDQSFRQKQMLKRHLNMYHNPEYVLPPLKEKIHKCPECDKRFRHKGSLIRHMELHDPSSSSAKKAIAPKIKQRKKIKTMDSWAVQTCPICEFQATTKNPYRHLQDHLARVHFRERIAADLPTERPYICPMAGCDGDWGDQQAVRRHYLGRKHGILDKFVKETLSEEPWLNSLVEGGALKIGQQEEIKIMESHQVEVRSAEDSNSITCAICGKVFTTRSGLGMHKRLRKTLYEHTMAMHRDVRYLCDHCDHVATNQRNLRRHMTRRHEGIPLPSQYTTKTKTAILAEYFGLGLDYQLLAVSV